MSCSLRDAGDSSLPSDVAVAAVVAEAHCYLSRLDKRIGREVIRSEFRHISAVISVVRVAFGGEEQDTSRGFLK